MNVTGYRTNEMRMLDKLDALLQAMNELIRLAGGTPVQGVDEQEIEKQQRLARRLSAAMAGQEEPKDEPSEETEESVHEEPVVQDAPSRRSPVRGKSTKSGRGKKTAKRDNTTSGKGGKNGRGVRAHHDHRPTTTRVGGGASVADLVAAHNAEHGDPEVIGVQPYGDDK